MRFWFAPGTDVPLYKQLVTQIQLAILSGDLRPGDRLPSTRELARRYAIHPNTVSVGYRELERTGWTELRHGSGVYVCDRTDHPTTPRTKLDAHIAHFFREARQAGLPMPMLRARLQEWLAVPPPNRWLLLDPDPGLRQILIAEMKTLTTAPISEAATSELESLDLAGAVVCCRPSQEQTVRSCLREGTELVVLPITSATTWLLPWLPAPQGHLIAVVSHWPDFLSTARTMLAAAAVPPEALLFRDARQPDWHRGLEETSGILCDAFSAQNLPLPEGPQIVVFPLLADAARDSLRLPEL